MKLACSLVFVLGVSAFGCRPEAAEPRKTDAVITVIGAGPLLNVYQTKLHELRFVEKPSLGSFGNVDAVESGLADVAFVQSDVAYRAFSKGTDDNADSHRKLRGMIVLYTLPMHLILAPGVEFKNMKDLRGKRIGVPRSATSTEFTARQVLSGFEFPSSALQLEQIPPAQIPAQLADGSLDAVFDFVNYRLIKAALSVPGTRLVPIEGAATAKLREEYPFLRPVVIPAGAHGQKDDIQTLGIDRVVICRDDLDEDIVYRMLSVFFDSIPEMVQLVPELRTVRLDHAAGTPIPLHPGAARFYRERELFR